MAISALTEQLSPTAVPQNSRGSGMRLILLSFLLGFGTAVLLTCSYGPYPIHDSALAMAGGVHVQHTGMARVVPMKGGFEFRAQPFRQQTTSFAREFAGTPQASAKAHLIARAEVAEPVFKLGVGDIVSHKERGQGTVVAVDPAIQVKYDKDKNTKNFRPISYTDEAGKPLPDDEIKAKLTLVKSAPPAPARQKTPAFEPKGSLKAGQLAPLGFFDPVGLSAKVGEEKLLFYREAELKHGRVCMVATLGIVFQEKFHTFFPNIDVPAAKLLDINYNEGSLQGLWAGAFFVLGAHEIVFDIMGANGAVPKSPSYKPEPGVQPGDLGWDPLNLKPSNPEKLIEIQNKELNNGRLAMFAALGIIAQEMVTDKKIF